MAEDIIMPPPERAAKTALGTSTVTSYLKANDILKSDVPKGKTLDFGAGRGLGAKAIGADTYEPYVKSNPKYNQVNQIKSNSYDKVTSLNVLNTIEPKARKEVVKNIGRVLKSNGVAVISTRGKDVEDAKIKTKAKDGYIIGKGEQARFQKGFTQDELKSYVQKTLGDNYKVESVKGLGKAAIKVKKLNVDPTPTYKSLSIKGANFPGGKLTKRFNEGGTAMKKQMELFEDGGLKDEGGMTDEVSGNDVPSGSTREEVRDDIPAQLSEGEFVFPADVVRYIGLAKLMQLRQEAKQGLKQMEAMGQMGNSDEATMPDDLPFDETDLDIEDDLEYNTGGVVQAQRGTYLAPTIPTQYRNESIDTTNPMGMQQIQTGLSSGVSGATFGTPYTPNVGRMYGAGATPYAPVTYQDFLGTSASGAPQTETVRYFNEATGQSRMIPHVVNADGSRGPTLYPIPDGFVIQEEAPKEEAKKAETKVSSAKVKPVDAGNDSRDQEEREREEAMYGRGAGRISLGGEIKPGTTVKTGFLGKGTSSLTKKSNTFGISYDFPGGILPGIATIKAITAGTGNLPDGATGKFTKNGLTLTKSAEVTNAIIKNPRGPEAEKLIKQHVEYRKSYSGLKNSNPDLTDKQVRDIVNAMVQTNVVRQTVNNKIERNFSVEDIDSKSLDNLLDAVNEASTGKDGGFDSSKFNSLPSGIQETYQEAVTQKEDDQQQYGTVGDTNIGVGTDTYDSSSEPSYDSSYSDTGSYSDTSFEGSYEDDDMYNKGGLAGKKKTPKPKKMKRGGLASR